MKRMFTLAFAITALPSLALAHGAGVSLEKDTGKILVDIGYEPEVLTDLESAAFDFSLWDSDSRDIVEFDYIWVRILRERDAIFASGIARQAFGPTMLVYRFPGPGEYTLDVSYRDSSGAAIAEAEFPLSVIAGDEQFAFPYWHVIPLTLLLVAAYVLGRRRATL